MKKIKWIEVKNAPRKRWWDYDGNRSVVGRQVAYHDGINFRYHMIELDNGKRHLFRE